MQSKITKRLFRAAARGCASLLGVAAALPCVGHAQGTSLTEVTTPVVYSDGRPYPSYRMDATDLGKFLDYGQAPNQTDYLGIREALINQVDGNYYLFYDGAGPTGWLAHLAVSTDLVTWERKGPILDFGAAGSDDSAAACAPWIIKDDDGLWHMFYLGTPNASGAPNYTPSFPYLTLRATASSPAGPWTKHYTPKPFDIAPGTYYSVTVAPGCVVKQGNEYLQFFSSTNSSVKRTLGIARTADLATAWTVDATPALPVEEQIENSSLYFEPTNSTWFLFTNHVGIAGGEYTDGVWVYWTTDLNTWNPANKAVVLDGTNCIWSSKCIGMPSVTVVGNKLYIFYDAPGGASTSHMQRSLGMATLDLPLNVSVAADETAPAIQTLAPTNGQIGVAPSANLVVTFDEAVKKGTGNIVIKEYVGDAVVETIPVTDARVSISGAVVTINPAGSLAKSTRYYAEIAGGSIADLVSNGFAGITGNATWSFTTGASDTTSIPVGEHSFEGAKTIGGWTGGGPAAGSSTGTVPAPWVKTGSGFGSQWTVASQYSGGIPDGDIYAYANGGTDIRQTLATTLQADTIYTLTVAVGWRKDLPGLNYPTFPGYGVELWAGGVKLASDYDAGHNGTGAATPASDEWKDAVVTYTSPSSVTSAPLEIRLIGYAIQTNYDNVRLTAESLTSPHDFNSYISDPAFGLDPAERGFALDPDGDRIPNGLEAWFGTHPGEFSPGLVAGTVDAGANSFTHPLNANPATDLTATYRWSTDLAAFYNDGEANGAGTTTVNFSQGAASGGMVTVTATITGTVIPDRLFMDVVVTQN